MPGTTIETHSGRYFDFANPQAKDVQLVDIAHALSNVCRFGGHIPFYSVAEHALLCQRLVAQDGGTVEQQLGALHHDSHEAYLGDIPTPLKRALDGAVEAIAESIDEAICRSLGLFPGWLHRPKVRWADEQALAIEARRLKHSRATGPHWDLPHVVEPQWWTPGRNREIVEHEFIVTHLELVAAL